MTIKIILDCNALSQLIGGDSKIELELRQAVVEEFSKRHLKEFVDSKTMVSTLARLSKALESHMAEEIGTLTKSSDGWNTQLVFKPSNKLMPYIKEYFDEERLVIVQEMNKTFVKELKTEVEKYKKYHQKLIFDLVNKAIPKEVDRLVEEGIQERLLKASGNNK